MKTLEVTLFADYFQFYVQDDDEAYGDLSNAWSQEAVDDLLAVSDHVIGVGTVRNMDVPVFVEILDTLPILQSNDWDRINYSSITCDTGRLVIAGCTDYFPDAKRIEVKPGHYKVAIGYKNLEKISEDGLDGEDSYHLFFARVE
jgi:hypothetical protein